LRVHGGCILSSPPLCWWTSSQSRVSPLPKRSSLRRREPTLPISLNIPPKKRFPPSSPRSRTPRTFSPSFRSYGIVLLYIPGWPDFSLDCPPFFFPSLVTHFLPWSHNKPVPTAPLPLLFKSSIFAEIFFSSPFFPFFEPCFPFFPWLVAKIHVLGWFSRVRLRFFLPPSLCRYE